MLSHHAGRRRKRSCMRLAAGVAVTVPNGHIKRVYFILDASAQTASSHEPSFISIKILYNGKTEGLGRTACAWPLGCQ